MAIRFSCSITHVGSPQVCHGPTHSCSAGSPLPSSVAVTDSTATTRLPSSLYPSLEMIVFRRCLLENYQNLYSGTGWEED